MKLISDLGALLTLVAFAGACAHSAAPAEPSSPALRPEARAPLVEPPAPRPLTGENPFSGAKLYVDPDTTGVLVEDCAVCCRPWTVTIERDMGKLRVQVSRAQ